jgi:hypothetical protein
MTGDCHVPFCVNWIHNTHRRTLLKIKHYAGLIYNSDKSNIKEQF